MTPTTLAVQMPEAAVPPQTIPLSVVEMHAALDALDRPRLLVEAARHGAAQYQRRRDLRRMLRVAIPANAERALAKLIPMEADLERRRIGDGRSYSVARHVDILAALMCEARDLKAQRPATPDPKVARPRPRLV